MMWSTKTAWCCCCARQIAAGTAFYSTTSGIDARCLTCGPTR